ncbi:MAG: MBL fold metallo-hydrolase [Lewinellaceae bacterium]|nr:MBL fold metallo-hydrolase [Lewinellaceae bacterium]
MTVEQIYTGCLAQGAYYVESKGEAIVIDPLREVQPYIEKAEKNGAKIKYVFETHFHADFVSGHIDLAKKTGAKIVYGPTSAKTGFETYIAQDGEVFNIGDVKIKVLHTPGHTMESSCYLLIDENGKETALFTGDTLFIGDVGRPDLAQHVISDLTEEKLAGHLFDSLRNKIMPLNDDLIVYPAHGAGSACGKNMSKETSDTLGNQKKTNYALRPELTKELFIGEVLNGLMPPPGYFPKNVLMNIQGYESIDTVLERGNKALNPREFELLANETHALILDTRSSREFASGFIPNAINIGIDGSFAVWVGTLIPDIKQEILVVADNGREEEVVTRLARVGYDYTLGYLNGGMDAWRAAGKEIDTVKNITAAEFAQAEANDPKIAILDVRKASEFNSEHIVNAENAPLDYVNDSMKVVNPDITYYVHCAGGYRSMSFISILKSRGYENFVNVDGGFNEIKSSGMFKLTDYVCPTTLL